MTGKRKTFQWLPDDIREYNPLYKGRRFWVFENDKSKPYQGWATDHDVLLYDRDCGDIIAVGSYSDRGWIRGCVLWGQGCDFDASSPRDMIDQTLYIATWYR
jgi:hypothetical protein